MRGAEAAAVAEAAFSTVGVKSFSRVEHVKRVEYVEMGMYFRRAGARGSRINANSENQGN